MQQNENQDENQEKHLDLEKELNNGNLDFLEEESEHPTENSNANLNIISKYTNKKFIKYLLIVLIIVGIMFFVINKKREAQKNLTNHIKQNNIKSNNIPVHNVKQTNEQPNENNAHHDAVKEQKQNSNISSTTEVQSDNIKQPPEPTKTISISPANSNHENNQNELVPNKDHNGLSSPQQIGQIKFPQSVKNNKMNNSEEISTNHNLTWQDIKKSVESTPLNTTKQFGDNISSTTTESLIKTTENKNNSKVNVNGFERTANNNILSQVQNNQIYEEYKAQQEYIKELKSIIADISKDLNNNVAQIKELQNNLIDISKFISNINNNVNNIDNKVLGLTNSLDNLSIEVNNVKKYIQDEDLDLNVNLKSPEPDLFNNNPEYIIHAIIPGRAWLKNNAGQIITVAEGDQLGDYGKIALIDANNNLVRTSSGIIFR